MRVLIIFSLLCFCLAQNVSAQSTTFDAEHAKKTTLLLEKLASNQAQIRLEAEVEFLKHVKVIDVEMLSEHLKKGNIASKQIAIIRALGKIGDPLAGEALRFEINHGKDQAIVESILALGFLGHDWAVPLLAREFSESKVTQLSDLQRFRRLYALVALGRIGSSRALQAIELSDKSFLPYEKKIAEYIISRNKSEFDKSYYDSRFDYARKQVLQYKSLPYIFHAPPRFSGKFKQPWLLICIHDAKREIDALYEKCHIEAKKREMALLIPHFTVVDYLRFQTFGLDELRSDIILIELLNHIRKNAKVHTSEVYLYGENEGAQFVQLFSTIHPRNVASAVAIGESFSTPNPTIHFPEGLRRTPLVPDVDINIYDYLKSDLFLISNQSKNANRNIEKIKNDINSYEQEFGIKSRIKIFEKDKSKNPFVLLFGEYL